MPRRSSMSFASIVLVIVVVPAIGCASTAGPRQLRTSGTAALIAAADWSRVETLPPGSPVVVTMADAAPRARSVVRVHATSLTLLDLSEASVSRAAVRSLTTMAVDHPEWFPAVAAGQVFEQDGVRIGRDGVFVRNRQVAGFDGLVESVRRQDVREVRGPVVARGSVVGPIVGGVLGFSTGVVPGLGGARPRVAWSALIGSIATGAFVGSHWSSHLTEGLVYRADGLPGAGGVGRGEAGADVESAHERAALATAAERQPRDGRVPTPARSFEALQAIVHAGDVVEVVDREGRRTTGPIVTISGASLVVRSGGAPRTFIDGTVSRVERRWRDPRRNGTLIGLGAGTLVGWLVGRTTDSPTCPRAGVECGQGALIGVTGGALWGAVGGWTADTLVRNRQILYQAQPASSESSPP